MSVRARVPIHGASHIARDAGHRLDPFQSACDARIDYVLQQGARFGSQRVALPLDPATGKLQNDARKSSIRNDQIRSATEHHARQL